MALLERLRGLLAFSGSVQLPPELSPEAVEEALILADAGPDLAAEVAAELAKGLKKGVVSPGEERAFVKRRLLALFPPPPPVPAGKPQVVLVVGVNGSGKTTTAAKLAARISAGGGRVLLAACDTFRAAAGEQLKVWGERLGLEVVAQRPGADPGAVLFDALAAATSRQATHVIVDTAGRLHTKDHLMRELAKLYKVASKAVPGAPHQVLLVVDATTGVNGLVQARQFREHAGVTGLVLTKLDGTAKGGVVLAIAYELRLPVLWVGVGERAEDLVPFEPDEFVEALLEETHGS
ncbi:MAG: signal recognition particle-docking protein FtsY [Thermoanaerobaculum sp.]